MSRFWARSMATGRTIGIAIVAALSLVGCADDGGNRRFANDPRPTPALSEPTIVVTRPPESIPPTAAPTKAVEELLRPRGEPTRFYFSAGNELWLVDLENSRTERIWQAATKNELIAFSPSPSAAQVAVLAQDRTTPERADVYVLNASGKPVEVFTNIAPSNDPDLPENAVATWIDWSPQGDQLLIGFEPGGVKAIPIEKHASYAVANAAMAMPRDAAWSPTGEQVAMITEGKNGPTLKVVTVPKCCKRGTPIAAPVRVEDLGLAESFAWMPDGRRLLVTRFPDSAGPDARLELWEVGIGTERRRLVLSAGSTVPAGSIDQFSLAADGRALAYTVTTDVGGQPQFDSLWVTDFAGAPPFRVPLPAGAVVTNLWWTSRGLVAQVVMLPESGMTSGAVPFSLLLIEDQKVPASLVDGTMPYEVRPTSTPAPTPTPLG